jgi:hypothetical protein
LHPTVYFGPDGLDYSESSVRCDLKLRRRTVAVGEEFSSVTGLSTYKITTDDQGVNELTGESQEIILIDRMELWYLY